MVRVGRVTHAEEESQRDDAKEVGQLLNVEP
jgi:hypothetical protein